jgi:glutathione-regulated potassium-efflux system ancillary protein KefG
MQIQNKILVIFAHPLLEKSIVNKALIEAIPKSDHITFRDLYELYPEFDIDVEAEQKQLSAHDVIIWHHPMYWYSCPPLLKQWIDMVLEYNWAYGKLGNALNGKYIFQTITTGGNQENYCATGKDKYTMLELLEPFIQTARVCKMNYLPPFVVHGTHRISAEEVEKESENFTKILNYFLVNPVDINDFQGHNYLNNWIQKI